MERRLARPGRWMVLWALLSVGVAALGMAAMSLLLVPEPESVLWIHTRQLPDVSRHIIPPSLDVAATTPDPPTAIWLVGDGATWRALSDRSTHHRACQIEWLPDEQIFMDPRLGTIFDRTGLNVGGPAPRGLDVYLVKATDNGQVGIDLSRPETATWSES